MNVAIFLLLTTAPIISGTDVIRTVFCRKQCRDYLEIPEHSMPLCAPEHLQLKECGTVISCDWTEADRDKVRPIVNSSDVLCCYQAVVKEKGDCVEQQAAEPEPVHLTKPFFDFCGFHFCSWILCFVFFIVVVLQAGYIVKLRTSGPKHRKVSQFEEMNRPRVLVTRPLIDMRHFDATVSRQLLSADQLPSAKMTDSNIPLE
ncbi:hypothetical protein KIN20_000795 [Parelaphostrongylus tenuis]|uniref:Uncharacterized protein n=1 Tax=Parelaphostrongylus tenuis TaxID=148309 RepID=A0AAD5LW08_PARTN|nr:hypothetical protein KIN20_000795 [Parelaphostrongylus tenuis]